MTMNLTESSADNGKTDEKDFTAFLKAVLVGDLDVVRNLFSEEVATYTDHKGSTPLYIAAREGHLPVVEYLISKGIDIHYGGKDGRTPLHGAACLGHLEVAKYLLSNGAEVDRREERKWTALHVAAQFDQLEIIQYLLIKNADIHNTDILGRSPLHDAVEYGYEELVKYLLSQGAAVNKRCNEEQSSLDIATREGRSDIIKILMSYGAIPKQIIDDSMALHDACHDGDLDLVKELLSNGVDVHATDEDGWTPLHAASVKSHLDVVKCLLRHGADTNKRDSNGSTPLCHAAFKSSLKIVQCLVEAGADVNKGDNESWKPLRADSVNSDCESVLYLLSKGADETVYCNGNCTPVDTAQRQKNKYAPKSSSVAEEQRKVDKSNNKNQPDGGETSRGIRGGARGYIIDRSFKLIAVMYLFTLAVRITPSPTPSPAETTDSLEQITLQAGKAASIPFHLSWPNNDESHVLPYFTLRFESEVSPFSLDGMLYIEGFKGPFQSKRFSTSVNKTTTSLDISLSIYKVHDVDEDIYVLSVILHGYRFPVTKKMKKVVLVENPPGRAKCNIFRNKDNSYPYEAYCRARSGDVETTLTCYLNGEKIVAKGNIYDHGSHVSGAFLLPEYSRFSCCSHELGSTINEKACKDFTWNPDYENNKSTTLSYVGMKTSVPTAGPKLASTFRKETEINGYGMLTWSFTCLLWCFASTIMIK